MNRISAIVTFHAEGIVAHTALRCYFLAREHARRRGLDVRFVLVLDRADAATTGFVHNHPELDGSEVIVETSVGDAGQARNIGIERVDDGYVAILDGDDLISRTYFIAHVDEAGKVDRKIILHPEMVVSFGVYNTFSWQVDQAGKYFDPYSMLSVNPWISAVFADVSVFRSIPYESCNPARTGFGFEDWYWNSETIAHGYQHRLAWGSAYFYRRKSAGSRNEASLTVRTVMPRTGLFSKSRIGELFT